MRISKFNIAVFGLLALSACGSSPETPPAETKTAAAPTVAKAYGIGEAVSTRIHEFTLTSVEERSKPDDSPYADAAGTGEVFVIAKFTIKNLGSKPVSTSDLPEVELLDGNSTVYSEDLIASAFAAESGGIDDVNPGVTYRSGSAWKVAKGAFDPATWKIVVRDDPAFEYSLR